MKKGLLVVLTLFLGLSISARAISIASTQPVPIVNAKLLITPVMKGNAIKSFNVTLSKDGPGTFVIGFSLANAYITLLDSAGKVITQNNVPIQEKLYPIILPGKPALWDAGHSEGTGIIVPKDINLSDPRIANIKIKITYVIAATIGGEVKFAKQESP
jgi:hypothetical protein